MGCAQIRKSKSEVIGLNTSPRKSSKRSIFEMNRNQEDANNNLNKSDITIKELKINRSVFIKNEGNDPYNHYKCLKTIAESESSKVVKVLHLKTNTIRVMKIIQKTLTKKEEVDIGSFMHEIEVLKELDHPNILKIYEYYHCVSFIYIIMEYFEGGHLLDVLSTYQVIKEKNARNIMKQILSAVAYCHSKNILHRDLTSSNILVSKGTDDDPIIKIIDFGTSEIFEKSRMNTIPTHKFSYTLAPEILNGQYNEKCDLWSCGVLLYIMLAGSLPFAYYKDVNLLKKVVYDKPYFPDKVINNYSKEVIDLIKKLLEININKRLSAVEALNHQWFLNSNKDDNKNISQNTLINLKNFNAEQKLLQAFIAFIVHNLVEYEQCKEVKRNFEKFDKNKDGKLSKQELIDGMCTIMTRTEALQEVNRILSMVDTDNNGFVEYNEFIRASLNMKKILNEKTILDAFNLLDRDGSGIITKDEIKEVLFCGHQITEDNIVDQLLKQLDSTEGELSFNEFKDIMYKFIKS